MHNSLCMRRYFQARHKFRFFCAANLFHWHTSFTAATLLPVHSHPHPILRKLFAVNHWLMLRDKITRVVSECAVMLLQPFLLLHFNFCSEWDGISTFRQQQKSSAVNFINVACTERHLKQWILTSVDIWSAWYPHKAAQTRNDIKESADGWIVIHFWTVVTWKKWTHSDAHCHCKIDFAWDNEQSIILFTEND